MIAWLVEAFILGAASEALDRHAGDCICIDCHAACQALYRFGAEGGTSWG